MVWRALAGKGFLVAAICVWAVATLVTVFGTGLLSAAY